MLDILEDVDALTYICMWDRYLVYGRELCLRLYCCKAVVVFPHHFAPSITTCPVASSCKERMFCYVICGFCSLKFGQYQD